MDDGHAERRGGGDVDGVEAHAVAAHHPEPRARCHQALGAARAFKIIEHSRTKRGLEFPLDETNQEIGAEIGTVRDLVSRNLRRFVDRGIIRLERRKVIVLDLEELEAQAAGTKRATP